MFEGNVRVQLDGYIFFAELTKDLLTRQQQHPSIQYLSKYATTKKHYTAILNMSMA
jgi:hypothetical protein